MGFTLLSWIALVSAYLITRIAEFRIHRVNYDFLIFAGGEEILAKRMRLFYLVSFISIPLALADYWLRGETLVSWKLQLGGVSLIISSLLLRLWVMRSLGHRWSMRCVFVSGYPKAVTGPYKFFKHPEYLSRYCEGVGLCMYLGSMVAAGAFTLIFWSAARAVVIWEERQLSALSVDLQESIR